MADPNLNDTSHTLHSSDSTEAAVGSNELYLDARARHYRFMSSDVSVMARFSLDLRELKAANVLYTLSEISESQMLDTQAIMHELSTDSEVTFRRELGSAEILPTRPGIDHSRTPDPFRI